MRRSLFRSAGAVVLVFAINPCLWAIQAKTPAAPKDPGDIAKLADGVFAQIVAPENGAAISNSGILVLDRGVLVFDTHFTPEAGQLLQARIQSLTSKPVRFVVNSHFHPDHTHGNQAFANSPLIIGSTNARRDMLQQDIPSLNRVLGVTREQLEKARKEVLTETEPKVQERMRASINSRQGLVDSLSRLKILVPLITVDDSLTLWDPAREVRLLYLGNGHTEGDLVLFLPVEKIVFAADLFFNESIPNTQDASILDWMRTLEALIALDADRFVPGHGPVGTKQDVKQFLAYFEELKALVEPAVTRGDTIEQVLEIPIPSKYAGYRFQNLFRPNLEKMYRELKARQMAEAAKARPAPVE
jgi:cyclase